MRCQRATLPFSASPSNAAHPPVRIACCLSRRCLERAGPELGGDLPSSRDKFLHGSLADFQKRPLAPLRLFQKVDSGRRRYGKAEATSRTTSDVTSDVVRDVVPDMLSDQERQLILFFIPTPQSPKPASQSLPLKVASGKVLQGTERKSCLIITFTCRSWVPVLPSTVHCAWRRWA